jgi:hypothetical protein
MQKQQFEPLTPYDNFVYALKSKESKRQYPHRLDKFISFLELEGTLVEKCNKLYELGKDISLLHSGLIQFINVQKERIDRKELAEGTLYNYVKAIKLFCNMNDIMINWKKIGKMNYYKIESLFCMFTLMMLEQFLISFEGCTTITRKHFSLGFGFCYYTAYYFRRGPTFFIMVDFRLLMTAVVTY